MKHGPWLWKIGFAVLVVLVSSSLTAPVRAAGPSSVGVVQAPDTPVKLDQIKLLNTDGTPLVLLYGATNVGGAPIDQFTVTVLVFDRDKRLKARQVAPARRGLNVGETKFSAMVLDVGGIDPTDSILAGVDQAQTVGSDAWWRADLRTIAENTMKTPTTAPAR